MIKTARKHIVHHVKRVLARKKSKEPVTYSDVSPDKEFYLTDGRRLKNINELAMALKDMSADIFHHHVNKDKNDFANWINDVIGSKNLAKKLSNVKNKKKYTQIINNQIKNILF